MYRIQYQSELTEYPLSKWRLFELLGHSGGYEVTIYGPSGKAVRGILSAVQREDGSGSSFNITLSGQYYYCHTID